MVTAPVPMVTAPVEVLNVPVLPEKSLAVDPLAVRPPLNVADPVRVAVPSTTKLVPNDEASTDPLTASTKPTVNVVTATDLDVRNFLLIFMVLYIR